MEYTEEEIQRGLKYAAQLAREEARAKALEEGRVEGRAMALAQDRAQGEMNARIMIAKNMIAMNLPKEMILAATRLSEEDFEKLT
ncbi:MAG: hypothetical protein HDS42_06180 [Bacteroides sp.]|nr:hypothetical protein [Bacteroides sp.]